MLRGSSSEQQLAQPEWKMNSQIHTCPFGKGYADSYGKGFECYNLSLIFKSMRNVIKAAIPTCYTVLFSSRSYRFCQRGQYFDFPTLPPLLQLLCHSAGHPQGWMCPWGSVCVGTRNSEPKIIASYHLALSRVTPSPPCAGLFLLRLGGVKWETYFFFPNVPDRLREAFGAAHTS